MLPIQMRNLLEQAKQTATKTSTPSVQLQATLITPKEHIPFIMVEGLQIVSDFIEGRADVLSLTGRIQPGVFQDRVLPYKDNLIIELIESASLNRVMRRYRATPGSDGNNRIQGQSSKVINMAGIDALNFIAIQFTLYEIGYDLMRVTPVSDSCLAARVDDTLHSIVTATCKGLGLTGADAFRGVDIESPIDNLQVYRHIAIRQGVNLANVGHWLQNEGGIGIYTRGFGGFYRRGMWYYYPITKPGRYGKIRNSVDIFRIPSDVMPDIDQSMYQNDNAITLIATGGGDFTDGTDILHQNYGSGQQLIAPSAVSGQTGTHYNNGRAIKTRTDTLTEYQTKKRASGNDTINMEALPTGNPFPHISATAMRDMQVLEVEWNRSSHMTIYPGAPVRYYYIESGNVLKSREGTIGGIKSWYRQTNAGASLDMRIDSRMTILLFPEETVVA